MTADKPNPPRLADLAALTGFSVATISRALANHPGISDETKGQIKRVAIEQGYPVREPSEASSASATRRKDRNRICIVMPAALSAGSRLANPFELSLVGGIGAALRDRHLDFSIAWQAPRDDKTLLKFMAKPKYDGFIFWASRNIMPGSTSWQRRGVPLSCGAWRRKTRVIAPSAATISRVAFAPPAT
jgi:DNA-binding LacI/PurR family transcriptional regulator